MIPNMKDIVKKHELWLKTDGKEGERADFTDKNLNDKFGIEEDDFFDRVNLKRAIFKNAKFKDDLSFSRANFEEADFSCADFNGSFFKRADFYCANLSGADMSGDFELADFTNADLTGATLDGDFKYADFTNADLTGADMKYADLTYTAIFTFKVKDDFGFVHKSFAYKNGYLIRIDDTDYFDINELITKEKEFCEKRKYNAEQTEKLSSFLEHINIVILD